jgi:hypothetical protein
MIPSPPGTKNLIKHSILYCCCWSCSTCLLFLQIRGIGFSSPLTLRERIRFGTNLQATPRRIIDGSVCLECKTILSKFLVDLPTPELCRNKCQCCHGVDCGYYAAAVIIVINIAASAAVNDGLLGLPSIGGDLLTICPIYLVILLASTWFVIS